MAEQAGNPKVTTLEVKRLGPAAAREIGRLSIVLTRRRDLWAANPPSQVVPAEWEQRKAKKRARDQRRRRAEGRKTRDVFT
jgi:hypothetical protein